MKYIKWPKEKVENESKKYTSRFQFQKNSKYAYNKALKERWLDEFVWLKTPEHKENKINDKVHCVYAYVDNENKAIYIGRTNDIKIRHNRHNNLMHKYKKYDIVKTYFLEGDKELPSPIILAQNLTLEESQYYEDYYLKYYSSKEWKILNKGKTGIGIGSVGGFVSKLTYDYCKSIALSCKTRKEFERKNDSAYSKSCRMKWIDDFIPLRVYNERTYEECLEIAKHYSTNQDFRKNENLVYTYCKKRGWLEKFTWLSSRPSFTRRNISKGEIIELSKHCTFKVDFKKKYPNHYNKARRMGWLNELSFIPYQKYSYEEWYNIAKEYKSKQDFRKEHPELVQMAYKKNWFGKSDLFKSAKRKLSVEICLNIAKKYSTINELRKNDESVYQYLLTNDLFKKTDLTHIRNIKVKNMIIEFYKEDLNFPLSGGDTFIVTNRKSIKRILNALREYIGKKTNVIININDKRKIFISDLITFCKLEDIDYNNILEIEVLQNGETFQIIVNKGVNNNVQILRID